MEEWRGWGGASGLADLAGSWLELDHVETDPEAHRSGLGVRVVGRRTAVWSRRNPLSWEFLR